MFASHYPGEILLPESTPSEKILSEVYAMSQPGRKFVYIPLRRMLSDKQQLDLRDARGSRADRQSPLARALAEDPVDVVELTSSPWALHNVSPYDFL